MNRNELTSLGLMSGTSLDGVDISIIKTNGKNLKILNQNYYHRYSNSFKTKIKQFLDPDKCSYQILRTKSPFKSPSLGRFLVEIKSCLMIIFTRFHIASKYT